MEFNSLKYKVLEYFATGVTRVNIVRLYLSYIYIYLISITPSVEKTECAYPRSV